MRMNVFELSKRKGSLCLVALLSLVLGACASSQTRTTQRATSLDCPATIRVHSTQEGCYTLPQKNACVSDRGTVTFQMSGKGIASFTFKGASPFNTQNPISVQSGQPVELIAETPGNFTFDVEVSGQNACPPSTLVLEKKPSGSGSESRDGQSEGLTGTLQVGTGGGDWEEEKKP
jgi:hypothetical protein